MKRPLTVTLAAVWLFLATSVFAEESQPIMPLPEVQPGMQGYWRTVVSGTELREYPLEVIGVSKTLPAPAVR